jgi:tRNA 2-thiouridine synthesizing protein C
MTNILLIQQSSAFDGAVAREAQDLALALAATEHQVTLLYRDAAVLQLLPLAQQPAVKDFTLAQKLFELYDIAAVYVCQHSLSRYQLSVPQLRIPVLLAAPDVQQQLLRDATFVLVH